MRCRSNAFEFIDSLRDWKWQDRVDDSAHDKFDAFPLEEIVGHAIDFAQAIIERAIEPVIDALDGLSREFHRDAPKHTDSPAASPGAADTAP